ncbi:hypothetical protein [Aeromonas sp. 55A]|uniref:hypothetical protein n=1 Tax=Aeromonas sp. 55A TaxID=3452720 RepID=UPI003F7AA7BD
MTKLTERQMKIVRLAYIRANLDFYRYFVKEMAIQIFGISEQTVMADIRRLNAEKSIMQFNRQEKCWVPMESESQETAVNGYRVLAAIEKGEFDLVLNSGQ